MQSLANAEKILNQIIDENISAIIWNKAKYTTIYKLCAHQAIKNLLRKYPIDMTRYLAYNSRTGGFQNKLFHEFISLLDARIPICYYKNKNKHVISSIDDPRLNIFAGKTTFQSKVHNNIVKNETDKIYIGGRKSTYIKPFYIGKILEFKSLNNNINLIPNIESYSFEKIITSDIDDETAVSVTHLMVVPHYQIGAMLYINRARKSIVNKFKALK